jgi:Ca-activated chloride channel family protein
MTFVYPAMLIVAPATIAALSLGYGFLHRGGALAVRVSGAAARRSRWRRHGPPLLILAALALLLLGLGRPIATIQVPRVAGTVILAFDVSNSMAATDVSPTRLAAAQAAAVEFVRAQPDTVDVGVVSFDEGAMTTREPTNSHEETVATINRLRPAGGTSLGQAILASLTTIVGEPVWLPDPESGAGMPDLGYWGSATIVLLSDGEDTGGPDAMLAAEVAAAAGVRVETVGIGTVEGTTIEVDGFQVATALDEQLLTAIAQATAGSYHQAGDASQLADIYRELDLRRTSLPQLMELTGAALAAAMLLLVAGGLLMTLWHGRIV